MATPSIKLEYAGGLEFVFGKSAEAVPIDTLMAAGFTKPTLGDLVTWLHGNRIKERPEMFFVRSSMKVRPGILVLVNDADWELVGRESYELQVNDTLSFISTLHGG